MKFYIVHCGFYDPDLAEGIYENHVNFFIAASSIEEAKTHAKGLSPFKKRHMHVDGIQEIAAVGGYRLKLTKDDSLDGATIMTNLRYGSRVPQTVETKG